MGAGIVEAFAEIVALSQRLGVTRINELKGCWEHQVDEQWHISLNGHQEPVRCSAGVEVPPFHCYVQYNGWPAGVIEPGGGCLVGSGLPGENEKAFIEALRAA